MSFLKKIFSTTKTLKVDQKPIEKANLTIDENFVRNFTKKGGKFLYCTHQEEVNQNLMRILQENYWEKAFCINSDLQKILLIANSKSTDQFDHKIPFFTTCENLLSKEGNILFTSNQLGEHKLKDLPLHFIVFAKTSQLVKDKGDAMIAINSKKVTYLPTNIGAVKCYDPNKKDDHNLGNTNSKNLYLLLLEDL